MKNSTLALAVVAFFFAGHVMANSGDRHFLFKATALFPVQIEKIDPHNPAVTIVTKLSLGTKELINLALARPFDHPIASNEILIVNVNENRADQTELQVYVKPADGSPGGTLYQVCTVSSGGNPATKLTENSSTEKGKGTGLGPGTIAATIAGTPADRAANSLQSTDICASSNGSWTPGDHFPTFNCSATGIIGDIKGNLTSQKAGSATVALDGLIIKGMFTGAGSPIKPYPFGYTEP
jgi:hypothetical protein